MYTPVPYPVVSHRDSGACSIDDQDGDNPLFDSAPFIRSSLGRNCTAPMQIAVPVITLMVGSRKYSRFVFGANISLPFCSRFSDMIIGEENAGWSVSLVNAQ